MSDTDEDHPCRVCGTTEGVQPLGFSINGSSPYFCRPCYAKTLNETPHTCRGCGRIFGRKDGMHSTPLEPGGELVLQEQQRRNSGEEDWHIELEFINRVICAECCPAPEHDDGIWCSIMEPVVG